MFRSILSFFFTVVFIAPQLCSCNHVTSAPLSSGAAVAQVANQTAPIPYTPTTCPESEAAIRTLHQKMTDFKKGLFDAYYCK